MHEVAIDIQERAAAGKVGHDMAVPDLVKQGGHILLFYAHAQAQKTRPETVLAVPGPDTCPLVSYFFRRRSSAKAPIPKAAMVAGSGTTAIFTAPGVL